MVLPKYNGGGGFLVEKKGGVLQITSISINGGDSKEEGKGV